MIAIYRKTSNISRTVGGNKIIDHSNVLRASPVGVAPRYSEQIRANDITEPDAAIKFERLYVCISYNDMLQHTFARWQTIIGSSETSGAK